MNYEPLTVIPRYRVVGTEWIDTGVGIPAAPGQEFDSRGWPKSDSLEPVNEAAKRTRNYWRKNRAVPTHAYPSTPWSEKLNRIFLPHLGGRGYGGGGAEGRGAPQHAGLPSASRRFRWSSAPLS